MSVKVRIASSIACQPDKRAYQPPTDVMVSNFPTTIEEYRLHERFEYKMNRLARAMQNRLGAGLEQHGITRIQWIALTAIEIEEKRSPSDLAEHIGVSRPAISRMLKQMESASLIERSLIGDDGRTRQLTLTEKGRESMNLCWPHVKETGQHFCNKVTDPQREALLSAIHVLMLDEDAFLDKI